MKEDIFRIDIKKKDHTIDVMRVWKDCSGNLDFLDTSSLKMFKVRLDEALSNQVGWNRWSLKGPE